MEEARAGCSVQGENARKVSRFRVSKVLEHSIESDGIGDNGDMDDAMAASDSVSLKTCNDTQASEFINKKINSFVHATTVCNNIPTQSIYIDDISGSNLYDLNIGHPIFYSPLWQKHLAELQLIRHLQTYPQQLLQYQFLQQALLQSCRSLQQSQLQQQSVKKVEPTKKAADDRNTLQIQTCDNLNHAQDKNQAPEQIKTLSEIGDIQNEDHKKVEHQQTQQHNLKHSLQQNQHKEAQHKIDSQQSEFLFSGADCIFLDKPFLAPFPTDEPVSLAATHPQLLPTVIQSDIKHNLDSLVNQLCNLRLRTNQHQRLLLLRQRQLIEEDELRLKHYVEYEKFQKAIRQSGDNQPQVLFVHPANSQQALANLESGSFPQSTYRIEINQPSLQQLIHGRPQTSQSHTLISENSNQSSQNQILNEEGGDPQSALPQLLLNRGNNAQGPSR